jgi:hypothetical protein
VASLCPGGTCNFRLVTARARKEGATRGTTCCLTGSTEGAAARRGGPGAGPARTQRPAPPLHAGSRRVGALNQLSRPPPPARRPAPRAAGTTTSAGPPTSRGFNITLVPIGTTNAQFDSYFEVGISLGCGARSSRRDVGGAGCGHAPSKRAGAARGLPRLCALLPHGLPLRAASPQYAKNKWCVRAGQRAAEKMTRARRGRDGAAAAAPPLLGPRPAAAGGGTPGQACPYA